MKRPWLSAAKVLGVWLGAWFAIGFAVAVAYGEHGSVIFVYYGVFAGIVGGSLHALVVLFWHAVGRSKES